MPHSDYILEEKPFHTTTGERFLKAIGWIENLQAMQKIKHEIECRDSEKELFESLMKPGLTLVCACSQVSVVKSIEFIAKYAFAGKSTSIAILSSEMIRYLMLLTIAAEKSGVTTACLEEPNLSESKRNEYLSALEQTLSYPVTETISKTISPDVFRDTVVDLAAGSPDLLVLYRPCIDNNYESIKHQLSFIKESVACPVILIQQTTFGRRHTFSAHLYGIVADLHETGIIDWNYDRLYLYYYADSKFNLFHYKTD